MPQFILTTSADNDTVSPSASTKAAGGSEKAAGADSEEED